MRKIYSVFLTVMLFAAGLQPVSANGDERVPAGKKDHTSPLACPAAGIYTIGPGGDYASITLALADLYSCASITGPFVFELKSTYVSTVETFPITINAIGGSSAANTITFRPATGATALSITTNNTTGTILFDGGSNIIFDGRPGGAGTAKELTIQNTAVANAYAIRFVNDAGSNTITYCNIKSANNNAAGGTIILAGTNGTTGNDNITIDNNAIFDAAGGTPFNAIISAGNTSSATVYNSGIVISNNDIYNFFNGTGNTAGINAVQGSADWVISGNSFFETINRVTTGIFSAISAYNSQMSNFTISGNYIGGTATLANGNFTLTGSGILQLIRLSLSNSITNSIQGNTIRNIIFTSNSPSLVHSLINLADGAYNVGTVTSNTIGSSSFTGNIAINLNSSLANNNFAIVNCGAGINGMGAVNISNNAIGNIDMAGSSVTAAFQLINFSGNSGIYTIDNNTLGSSFYVPSVNNYLNTTLTAINGNVSVNAHSITNNAILNLWQPNTGSSGIIYGIKVQGNGIYNIGNNTINGLRSSATNTTGYALVGISNIATAPSQVITGNKILVFNTVSTTVRTQMAGIYYSGPAAGTNIIEKNFIHTFASNSTVSSTSMVGIHAAGGTATYRNNMVRFGINSAGGNIASAFDMEGIFEEAGINNFYFNTVYIGGTGVGSGNASYAFNSAISTNIPRSYKNNIFWNARSNSSLNTPLHYAVKVNGTAGITSDYNVLFSNGTGKMLANIAGTDEAMLALWRAGVSGDNNSYSVNPQLVNPTGDVNLVDLHIKPSPTPTIAEANGIFIASVTDDYDVQSRPSLSPTDIGADAGNFTAVVKADVGPVNLLNPTYFACLNATTTVKVVIKNFNSTAINFASAPVTLSVVVTGATVITINTTISTGTLAAGDTLIVTMPATLNMSTAGTYNFAIGTAIGGSQLDVDVTNNLYTTTVTPGAYNIGTLSSSVANFCNGGIPLLTLTGTFGNVQWQQASNSGGPWTNVGTNSLTYSPAAITATTYYQAIVSCGAGNGTSNMITVLVTPASIASTAVQVNGAATATICNGSGIILTQSGGSLAPGAQWQWYEGTAANNFITAAGPPTSAADASTVIVPTASTNYYVRSEGGISPCDGFVPAITTGNPLVIVTVKATGTWLGLNNDWSDVTNWCGGVPDAFTDVLIPSGLLNYPVIDEVAIVRNITMQSGSAISLTTGGELTILGAYANTNALINNDGKIILKGAAVQNFPGTTAILTYMKDIEVDNSAGVNIDQSFTLYGTLDPTNGPISLNDNIITLHSDALNTASVGKVGSNASINYGAAGKFLIERFIPAKRAWRLLTAPVTAATAPTINASWQEGATKWPMGPATGASNPADGYGAHISGGTNANGYDQNVNGNPSIKVFTAGSWLGMSVITSLYSKKVTDEPGYMLFVRGSRAVDLTFGTSTVPNNTTLRIGGKLNVANITPIGITSTGITCVGNPFASAINFNSFATQNGFTQAENKYYLWDPTLAGASGVGAWVTLAYNGSTYDRTVTAFDDYTSSGGSQGIDDIGTIQSGVAFMMDFGGTPRTVNFNETVKTSGSTSLVFRPMHRQMRTNLHWVNGSSNALLDGVLTTYNPAYSNSADALDVNKLSNFSENFGLSREGKVFAIERRKPVTVSDTIFFNMAQLKQRNYQLEFIPDSMTENNLACYLEDKFLNSSTPVSLQARTLVPFSITNNASAARDRFKLVFKQWIQYTNCSAAVSNEDVAVKWKVMQEQDVNHYEIERSTEEDHFTVVGNRSAVGNSTGEVVYNFTDISPAAGDYYYRIKAVSNHGVTAYSNTVKVRILRSSPALYVFPNPVINNQVNLQISSNMSVGYYTARLLNAEGKTITSKSINHAGGSAAYTILPGQSLAAGTYQLDVLLPNKSRQVIKIVVQ